jgi:putative selenate reductase
MCNECGNCATFCPHQGKPYRDKPRFALTNEGFQQMEGDAWHWDGERLWRRVDGRLHSLRARGSGWLYTYERVELALSGELRMVGATTSGEPSGIVSLWTAAQMAVVTEGLRTSLPWLLGLHPVAEGDIEQRYVDRSAGR